MNRKRKVKRIATVTLFNGKSLGLWLDKVPLGWSVYARDDKEPHESYDSLFFQRLDEVAEGVIDRWGVRNGCPVKWGKPFRTHRDFTPNKKEGK